MMSRPRLSTVLIAAVAGALLAGLLYAPRIQTKHGKANGAFNIVRALVLSEMNLKKCSVLEVFMPQETANLGPTEEDIKKRLVELIHAGVVKQSQVDVLAFLDQDPWGHPVRMRIENSAKSPLQAPNQEGARLILTSWGPNGRDDEGNDDDIVVEIGGAK